MAIVNTHVHLPPNFSAFTTVAEAVNQAKAEQVAVLGASNFYDQHIYDDFGRLARAAGILPLYGLEFITHVPDLADQGIRVNDPANPGRMYLTGKGIDPNRTSPRTQVIAEQIRQANDRRATIMVDRLAAVFARAGFTTDLAAPAIAQAVAERAGVDLAWVSLQERHIAQAFQQALSNLTAAERADVLERAYGRPSEAVDEAGLQAEIRSRLLKAGAPAFAPEVPLGFEQAYTQILDFGGIPCYPILADGADPCCEFEQSPERLADELLLRRVYAAELIPGRNARATVEDYVRVLRAAGLIVMAGTEHNTTERVQFDPSARDGALSDFARQGFFEGAALVAAHAERVRQGRPGYVDETGALAGDPLELINEGGALIRQVILGLQE